MVAVSAAIPAQRVFASVACITAVAAYAALTIAAFPEALPANRLVACRARGRAVGAQRGPAFPAFVRAVGAYRFEAFPAFAHIVLACPGVAVGAFGGLPACLGEARLAFAGLLLLGFVRHRYHAPMSFSLVCPDDHGVPGLAGAAQDGVAVDGMP